MTDTEAIAEMCFEFADHYRANDSKPTLKDRQRRTVLTKECHPAPGVFRGMCWVEKVEFQLVHAGLLPIMLPFLRPRRGHDPVAARTVNVSLDVYVGPDDAAMQAWRERHV